MINVQKLSYSSTCAYCDKGVEGGEGLRLLRTTGQTRTGFDFHKDCFSKVIRTAEAIDAATLIEIDGVFYVPGDTSGTEAIETPKIAAQKVIPKRRP